MKNSSLTLVILCGAGIAIVAILYFYQDKEIPAVLEETPVVETPKVALVPTTSPKEKNVVSPSEPPASLPVVPTEISKVVTQNPQIKSTDKTTLLSLKKVPSSQTYDVNLKEIPISLHTNIPDTEKGKYQICYSILENERRVSETDCSVVDKNISYDMMFSLEDFNLAPYGSGKPYYEGTRQLELMVTLVKNDPKIVYKITGDESADLRLLRENAVETVTSGVFTFIGK